MRLQSYLAQAATARARCATSPPITFGTASPPSLPMLLSCHTLPPVPWAPLPPLALVSQPQKLAVYRVSVAENRFHVPQLHQLLTAAEQQRAHRYHHMADYHRFVVRRAALRLLLGTRLGQPPAEVQLVAGANYKPALAAPHVQYNVSQAGSWVLIAIAPVEVGVDVEQLTSDFPVAAMLAHSFSPPEQAFITRHPSPVAAFFQLWTRKEAFVKATAQGIDADFSQVPALDGPHQWAAQHPSPTTDWVVSSFTPAPGYAAALAYPAAVPASQVQFYDAGSLLDLF